MSDFLRARTVADSLAEMLYKLDKNVVLNDGMSLRHLTTEMERYLDSLNGLKITNEVPSGLSPHEILELKRAKAGLQVFKHFGEVLLQIGEENSNDTAYAYHASLALRREGLFSPKQMYQLKEDFEAVSLLHSKHKKETERLLEEAAIATQRNAVLRLENDDLKARLEAIEKAAS